MAFDTYLKIDGIDGESNERAHIKWLQVTSMNFGASTPGGADVGSGHAAGKVTLQDFHFTKFVDTSTPKIVEACCSGQIFKFADLEACRSTGEKVTFLKYHFENLLISSYNTGGAAGDNGHPVEQISFNFTKVQISYTPFDEQGRPQGAVQAGYDIKQMSAF